MSTGPGVTRYLELPKEGWNPDHVREELNKLSSMEHTKWEDGRVSGAVYHGGQDLLKLQTEAFGQFGVANPIHPDVFPGVRKMEAEVVAMVSIPIFRVFPLLQNMKQPLRLSESGPCAVQWSL